MNRNAEAVVDLLEMNSELHELPTDDEVERIQAEAARPAPPPPQADARIRARSGKKRSKMVAPKTGDAPPEEGRKKLPPHPPPPTVAPEEVAPWWSRATWHWATGLVFLAWRSPPLNEEDVWPLPAKEEAEALADRFLDEWEKEKARAKTLPPPKPKDPEAAEKLPEHPPPSLLRALWKTFGGPMYVAAGLRYVSETGALATPILLGRLVTYMAQCSTAYRLGQPDLCPAAWNGYMLAFGIFCISLIQSWAFGTHFYISAKVGFRIRTALSIAVYRKSLRLSSAARLRWSGGAVVNLLSTDCARIDRTLKELHTIHAAPIVIIIGFALMIWSIGPSALASLVVVVVSIPLSGVVMAYAAKVRKRTNAITDERVKLTQETISGIRVVKYQGWERPLTDRILGMRVNELRGVRAVLWTWVVVGVISMAIPVLSAMAMFLTYSAVSSVPLTSAVVLQCIALVETIRWPLLLLPLALQWATESSVSLGRLSRMLGAEELDERDLAPAEDDNGDPDLVVEIENARFGWEQVPEDEDQDADTDEVKKAKKKKKAEQAAARKVKKMEEAEAVQRDGSNWVWRTKTKRGAKTVDVTVELDAKAAVEAADAAKANGTAENGQEQAADNSTFNLDLPSLRIKKNTLVCVVGAVGSGKSSLVSALVKDMKLLGGLDPASPPKLSVRGRIAYVPQLAWIQNATVKENIVFGKQLDEAKFEAVIKACAMEKDLEMLADGPDTIIGEKGLTLSGGQKARTSLARAIYSDADVYLLDDPLSAVDAHVGNHLVQEAILGALASKTRILTTHQLHVLPYADWVVVMRQGTIVEQGTFKDLLEMDGYLAALVRDHGAGLAGGKEGEDSDGGSQTTTTVGGASSSEAEIKAPEGALKISRGPSAVSLPPPKPDLGSTMKRDKQPRELMTQEERLEGAVALSVYADYFRFGGGFLKFVGPVLLFLILMQSCKILADWWVSSAWASQRFPLSQSSYQGIYAGLSIIQLVFVGLGGFSVAVGAIKSTQNIHGLALSNVIRAPVNSFFDVTPVGRILSRFSKDSDIVDSWIPDQSNWFLRFASNVIAVLVLIAVATPIFLVPFSVVLVLYVFISIGYRYIARDLKRLEAVTRSPVYALFSETLSGLSTIRAYGAEDRFAARAQNLLNHNNRFWFFQIPVVRWMGLRLEFLAALVVFTAGIFAVTASRNSAIDPGLLGLSITYSLQIVGILNGALELSAELEAHFNSVERLLFFAEEVETENYESGKEPPADWPQKGALQFKDVQMRYAPDLPLVLKGFNLDIQPGQRVGVVGRTGAGKSSIMQVLFRLVEPCGGSVIVDGLDLADVRLGSVRSKMSIIPQDPVLFSGSLRMNLDPFNLYSDDEIWDVLDFASNLKESIKQHPQQLNMQVAENGENFSLGERQLLCLSRTMLRRTKIVVLDEATAAVDLESDATIQRTLRTNPRFKGTTILTIAHRLNTVVDYDLIVYLQDGKVLECGSPAELVSRDGPFRKLVNETGKENAEVLVNLAMAKKYEDDDEFEREINMVRRRSSIVPQLQAGSSSA
ncbi:P-loop containing nucleoside triphosphate hydrolase protein [Hyaloraphidium curvatum]|nr:P-loop containing nucleoside triphosphate hydrolase protein [Hyaloraphidium curvatum]